MSYLQLRGVNKRFDGTQRAAVSTLDLSVEQGEVVVLVGPSGCGKSTALRIIAGLTDADGGSVELGGRELTGIAPQDRDIAMVFQGYALYPHMSVAENIEFPLKMRNVPTAQRRKSALEAAAMLGLEPLLKRYPHELSGGERQRVAMGRAIVRKPKLFLFDEPLSNLDAALRAELRVELAKLLRKLEATAIYVTHDQVEAMTLSDRLVVMRNGHVEQADLPRVVYEQPASQFVAGFLGSPPINLAELTRTEGRFSVGNAQLDFKGSEDRVIWALRPEAITVVRDNSEAAGLEVMAKVTMVEPLGAETIVHARVENPSGAAFELRAVCRGFFKPDRDATIALKLETKASLFFDPETGRRLS